MVTLFIRNILEFCLDKIFDETLSTRSWVVFAYINNHYQNLK